MAKMKAIMAAVQVMEKEGITQAFFFHYLHCGHDGLHL